MNVSDALKSCQWKHLRGEGRRAIYRATCGQGQCRGHLGDLRFQGSYEDAAADVLEEFRHEREKVERIMSRGESPRKGPRWPPRVRSPEDYLAWLVSREETARRRLEEAASDERAGRVKARQEWRMFAMPVLGDFVYWNAYSVPIYRGHPDSGYLITFGSKRSRGGNEIGRRPMYPADHQAPPWMTESYGSGRYGLKGQRVLPTDRIWCPMCGTLNQLDWPEPLKDSQAR